MYMHYFIYYIFAEKKSTKAFPRIAKAQLLSKLVLNCASTTVPIWFFNREKIPDVMLNETIQPQGSSLIILKIQPSHAGEYNCFGHDEDGNPFIGSSLLVVAGNVKTRFFSLVMLTCLLKH